MMCLFHRKEAVQRKAIDKVNVKGTFRNAVLVIERCQKCNKEWAYFVLANKKIKINREYAWATLGYYK